MARTRHLTGSAIVAMAAAATVALSGLAAPGGGNTQYNVVECAAPNAFGGDWDCAGTSQADLLVGTNDGDEMDAKEGDDKYLGKDDFRSDGANSSDYFLDSSTSSNDTYVVRPPKTTGDQVDDNVIDMGGSADRLDLKPFRYRAAYVSRIDWDGHASNGAEALEIRLRHHKSGKFVGYVTIHGASNGGVGAIERIEFANRTISSDQVP